MPEEEKIASASYVLTFLNDVELLLSYVANFINLLVQLKQKYPQEQLEKGDIEIEQTDQQALLTTVNALRSLVFKTYVRFNALKKEIKEFKTYEKKIKEGYEKIIDAPIPLRQDVEEYTINLNEVFVSSMMSEIISRAREILRGLTK